MNKLDDNWFTAYRAYATISRNGTEHEDKTSWDPSVLLARRSSPATQASFSLYQLDLRTQLWHLSEFSHITLCIEMWFIPMHERHRLFSGRPANTSLQNNSIILFHLIVFLLFLIHFPSNILTTPITSLEFWKLSSQHQTVIPCT